MFYDMDQKLCISDCSSPMSVPSPNASQSSISSSTSGYSTNSGGANLHSFNYLHEGDFNMPFTTIPTHNLNATHFTPKDTGDTTGTYTSELVILEQPTEKFRFRYKSEMHGTHGSLNGERSTKANKSFPEVELKNFTGMGVIRCSLYQTNMDKPSPHSHQLVVRKDDTDECDPHDVYVSPEKGYIARFENMGIIHTAKKNICDALYAKKKQKMLFETGCEELSQRQEKELKDEAEREGKLMNLNQVRLCFEAFKIVDGRVWVRICKPVFSRAINNRKSALTGELKICRLSAVAGSAEGKEDLILLVEKVSKKNIQVRFYEVRDDDQVWEGFGEFSDTDVHHQYAIVVRTPPYKNKDIDSNVNVFIELVRKSDDERSAPVNFRYKPRDIVMSRKRRRTSYHSSSSSPVTSSEIPVTVTRGLLQNQQYLQQPQTISQEFDKNAQIDMLFVNSVNNNSEELMKCLDSLIYDAEGEPMSGLMDSGLRHDGVAKRSVKQKQKPENLDWSGMKARHPAMKLIVSMAKDTKLTAGQIADNVRKVFDDYAADNDAGDTIIHDIVKHGQHADGIMLFSILKKLNLIDLWSQTNNKRQTPLHVASIFDQPAFIRPLLSQKCDPNIQDSNDNTALHIAIAENLKQCIESFVLYISSSEGSHLDANLANDKGLTPLHLAIRAHNIELVEILLRKGNASAKTAISLDGNNALHLAVQCQSTLMVKCLLDNSQVKVNAKNRSGHTAIDLAKSLIPETTKKEILDLLHAKLPSSSDSSADSMSIDSIKDEPDDDSSPDEDEDNSLGSEIEENQEETCFKKLLEDEQARDRLGKLLSVDDKWKKLSAELKMNHLMCLWINADAMLRYLYNEISPLTLFQALQVVDPKIVSTAIREKNL